MHWTPTGSVPMDHDDDDDGNQVKGIINLRSVARYLGDVVGKCKVFIKDDDRLPTGREQCS